MPLRTALFLIAVLTFSSCTKKDADPVVAEFGGKKIRASEAFGPVKTRLFDMEEEVYRIKEHAINEYIEKALLEEASKKAGLSEQQLIDKEMGTETKEVSDKEITDFLASRGLHLNDPRIKKADVRAYLEFQQRNEKRQQFVAKLKEKAKVKIHIEEPPAPKTKVATEGYPSWGNKNAPVTIVEFSDYQCGFCKRAVPTVKELKKIYGPDKIRVVYRDLPLASHPRANPAALAGLCANDQGKFWEYHDKVFENNDKLEDKHLEAYAKELSLNLDDFKKCYAEGKHQPLIDATKREAGGEGISATPSFVVNGTLMQGAQPLERFKQRIDRELKRKG